MLYYYFIGEYIMNTEQKRTRQDIIAETTERMEAIALLKLKHPCLPDTKIAAALGLDRSTISRLWIEYTQARWVPLLRKINRMAPDTESVTFTDDEVKMAGEMLCWFNGVRDNTATSTVRRADAARNREDEERRWIRIGEGEESGTVVCWIKGCDSEYGSDCHLVVEAKMDGIAPVYTVVSTTVPIVRISAPKGRIMLTASVVRNITGEGSVLAEASAETSVLSGYDRNVNLELRPCTPYPYSTEGRTLTRTAGRFIRSLRKNI